MIFSGIICSYYVYILRDFNYFSNRANLTHMKLFEIDHLDPMGQGVFKQNDQVYFIPKTLPGETGYLKVLKQTKGVNFARVDSLNDKSKIRVEPICSHFHECPGCHYLHTDYKNEIEFKKRSYQKVFSKFNLNIQDVNVIQSPNRVEYRNRIQLHYNLTQNKIGFIDAREKKIVSVPNCIIMNQEVKTSYQALLSNWQKLVPKKYPKGHVEIYHTLDGVKTSWNRPYAEAGFSQVNEAVNQLMKKAISDFFPKQINGLLDLFGGNGNLSNALNYTQRICVDHYKTPSKEFYHLDLFADNALEKFNSENKNSFETIILDPPRSGFKNLSQWLEHFNPKEVLYVSCHPSTQARDLLNIPPHYKITSFYLVDLFPATHHYESMVKLTNTKL